MAWFGAGGLSLVVWSVEFLVVEFRVYLFRVAASRYLPQRGFFSHPHFGRRPPLRPIRVHAPAAPGPAQRSRAGPCPHRLKDPLMVPLH